MVFNLFVFLFGLFVGSFLNCVIYRLALPNFSFWKNLGGLKNRSFCPKCRHKLNWYDLVPVFSFLILRGKCRYCGEKISWQYPLVELATAILFTLIFNFSAFGGPTAGWQFYLNLITTLYLFIIASLLIIIFVYDLKHYIIPDKVLFPAILLVLIFNFSPYGRSPEGGQFSILSALGAAGFFLLIFLISRGTWLGFGDVKLVFLMGLILGFPNILAALFLAFFFGAIIGIGLIIFGKKKLKSEIPFGPFLITGTFIAMLWGKELITWYLSFIT